MIQSRIQQNIDFFNWNLSVNIN